MKSLFRISVTISLLCLPVFVLAQTASERAAGQAAAFVAKFNEIILFPLIALLTAVAFLVFLWGCAQYFINATNDQARQQGVKHITFGIIGLVVMLSAFAILQIAAATFGLDKQLDCANDPSGDCAGVFQIPGKKGGPEVGNDGADTVGNDSNNTVGH